MLDILFIDNRLYLLQYKYDCFLHSALFIIESLPTFWIPPPTEYLTFFMTKSLPGAAAIVNTYPFPELHKTLKAHTTIQPNMNNKKTAGKHCQPQEKCQISSSDSGIISSQSICVG